MARCAVVLLILIAAVALLCAAQTPGLAQTDWRVFPEAVVKPTALPEFDDGGAGASGVAKVGDHYLMVYVASAAGATTTSLGVATSPDGIHWYKYTGNPVLTGAGPRDPCLLYDPSDQAAPYKAWYGIPGYPAINYAASNDGIHWREVGTALTVGAPGTYDEYTVFQPVVVHANGTYYMYYSARWNPGTMPPPERCIGVATSPDGINWTHRGPALPSAGGTAWDYTVGCPHVLYKDGQFLMWYKGMAPSGSMPWERIGFATSTDGLTFTRFGGNPILSPGSNPAVWPYRRMMSPSVVWDGSHFRLWFYAEVVTGTVANTPTGYAVSVGDSPTSFTLYPTPVLTKGRAEWAFDDGSLNAGGVAWVGDHYLMLFGGNRRDAMSKDQRTLGIATSPDGITWTKYPGNPVIGAPGGNPCLLYEPSDPSAPYKAWFDGAVEAGVGTMEIRYATSSDGLQWQGVRTVLTRGAPGSYDEKDIFQPVVVHANGLYYIYYSARWNPGTMPPPERCIAVATSPDGVTWTKAGVALPSAGGTAWDYTVGCPHVLYQDGQFLMWYKGMAPSGSMPSERIGFATSTDGLTFTRYAGNPILSPTSDPAVWPYNSMNSTSVVWDGTRFHMWFGSLLGDGTTAAIGYAVSAPGSPTQWTVHPSPVLQKSPEGGAFDAGVTMAPSVAKVGSGWVMYYEGQDQPQSAPSNLDSIGVARSYDGINWFKYSGNPVIAAEPNSRRAGPSVLYDPAEPAGKIWRMWYFKPGEPDANGQRWNEIVGCWSPDGYDWRDHRVVLSVPGTSLSAPSVLRVGDAYWMYTSGWGSPAGIGLATSSDAENWAITGPVLPPGGAGDPDEAGAMDPDILAEASGQLDLWYAGRPSGGGANLCYTTSPDGINWTKYPGNPVLTGTADLSVFPYTASAPTVVRDNDIYHMWFNGGARHGLPGYPPQGIGYAVSEPDAVIEETPQGTGVAVTNPLLGLTLRFNEVGVAGHTVMTGSGAPSTPAPPGYTLGSRFFHVATNAGYFGPTEISVTYDDSGMTPAAEAAQRLLHYNEGEGRWEDITVAVDTAANIITARTGTLSLFAVAEGAARTLTAGSALGAPGKVGTVPVSLNDAAGVAGIQFDLTYNVGRSGLLTPTAVRKGPALPSDWVIDYSTPSADVVRVVAYSSTGTALPAGASGVLALLDFTVNGATSVHESCTLHPHDIVLSDENGLPIEPVGSVDGTFTVIPPVHHFVVQVSPAPPEPQGGDLTDPLAFTVHVEARDEADALVPTYDETAALASSVGEASPASLPFAAGVWEGPVTIAADLDPDCTLTVTDAGLGVAGTSPVFRLCGKGDVNGDGSVNVLDVIRTVNFALARPCTPPPRCAYQFWAADMNRDHVVNILDVIQIVNKSLGRSPAPPAAGAGAMKAAAPVAGPVSVHLVSEGHGVWTVRVRNAAGLAGAQLEIAVGQCNVVAGDLVARAGWQVQTNPTRAGLRVIAYSPSATGLTTSQGTLLRLTNVRGKPRLASILLSDATGQALTTR